MLRQVGRQFGKSRLTAPAHLPTLKRYIQTSYVTTPIFYPNAEPHVGHLYSMVLADVIKRYNRDLLENKSTYLLTGIDEHGLKIQTAAAQKGVTPKTLCDQLAVKFRQLAEEGLVENDRFMRTTDTDHTEAVNRMWGRLVDAGYIYKGSHSGYYCISDETYYPRDKCHEVNGKLVSIETGKEVEWTEEENYFFRLSKMAPKLLEFYESHASFVAPKEVYQQIKQEVAEGLPDLSISRPHDRITWGIPVPGDSSQVIYVWLDALVNYATARGFSKENCANDCLDGAVHIVGKDIQRFHAIYWPAFLLAAGVAPPAQVLVHAHWISEGQKMSKSIGNVVDPFEVIGRYSADSVRFFLMSDGHLHKDNDFTAARITHGHNTMLVNKLGNLLMRITSPRFDLPLALQEPDQSAVDICTEKFGPEFAATRNELIESLKAAPQHFKDHMAAGSTPKTITDLYSTINLANKHVEQTQPWSFKDPETAHVPPMLLREAAEAARIGFILMQPFTPEFSKRGLDRLGVKADRRTMAWAELYKDREYGEGKNYKGDHPIQRIKEE